jgi:phosphoglycolate phosphatase-like HAD superfamily hydrolase
MAAKHLVWDWNGTLLDDLPLVVTATNAAFASIGGPVVSADEHRRDFRRPISDYYGTVLGRRVDDAEYLVLDRAFHDAYRGGVAECRLTADALAAMELWTGSQSLLSMWFHAELVPTVTRYGLTSYFARIDGLRAEVGGGFKSEHLITHLAELGIDGADAVLIGDSMDDADAAASVGARCILYTGGFTHPEQLRASGRESADSLVEAVQMALS